MRSKTVLLELFLCFILVLILSPDVCAEGKLKHVVNKGDTLWSICEKYYGNPNLWPELWEMNKFITNPHWLKPGDVITLLEDPQKALQQIQEETAPTSSAVVEHLRGVDISSLTNTQALGFVWTEKIKSSGKIFDAEAQKILFQENDIVYVKMLENSVQPGDKFTIYNVIGPISHPVTQKPFGYLHSFKGLLVIERAENGYHIARIIESFKDLNIDDLLLPYQYVSSCVFPLPCLGTFSASVVASKDNMQLIGPRSIVYVDAGSRELVVRGNIFEAVDERESLLNPEKKESVTLPPVVVAKIIILEAFESTSTGFVFWASGDFMPGIKVRPQVSNKWPPELVSLPACAVE